MQIWSKVHDNIQNCPQDGCEGAHINNLEEFFCWALKITFKLGTPTESIQFNFIIHTL